MMPPPPPHKQRIVREQRAMQVSDVAKPAIDDQLYETRPPSSARRYTSSVVPNTPRQIVRVTRHSIPLRSRATTRTSPSEPVTQPPVGRPNAASRLHWFVYVSLFLFVMLAGCLVAAHFRRLAVWTPTHLSNRCAGGP